VGSVVGRIGDIILSGMPGTLPVTQMKTDFDRGPQSDLRA
jgi:hypothetical protein